MPKKHFFKTRKHRKRGGGEGLDDYDIEQGPVIPVVPLRRIPSDPVKKQEELGRKLTSSISPAEAESIFNGPNPQEIENSERLKMEKFDKEDSDVAAYDFNNMQLFAEGGRRRRRTRRIRRKSRKTRKHRRKTKKHCRK